MTDGSFNLMPLCIKGSEGSLSMWKMVDQYPFVKLVSFKGSKGELSKIEANLDERETKQQHDRAKFSMLFHSLFKKHSFLKTVRASLLRSKVVGVAPSA